MRVRTQARRDAIVEAAAKLFEEVGYEAASMNELAKRLGGSKATLYGYFPSKEPLFVAVVQSLATSHLADATSHLLAALETRPPMRPTLTRFGDEALQVMLNDRRALSVYRMVLADAGRSNIGELFDGAGPRQCIDALTRFMGAAMAHGEVCEGDPQVMAMQFMALLTAETGPRLYQQDPPAVSVADIHARVVRAVDFFLRGTAPGR
ncbi:TetR/AcrR family transcriptional regulator [Acidovorax sp. SUPP1855]|uniref:TetR/AcrR family transcriptional regulator n=1 Tax=unclassified Acidovorax TaxID=2684926 RepID=UPI0023DE5BDB|nr:MULTISPECIES: TetR/AcrR family transcriptional regulator [unclassified Acidovorax]GKS87089.1 TetR/AcrR family transcriptional regulator [Acidovorax sp. SUPP1855]GKT01712.1 TetR/AcrR family transcriptional regulator [Acidovorax sp. SUPP3434]